MLCSLKKVLGYRIKATDGELGKVRHFLFDDEKWVVRYLVVDTGGFLSRNDVLISPIALKKIAWQAQDIEVSLTKEQVEKSPDIDTQKPVSRQHENDYFSYYGWSGYWGYVGPWGIGPYGIRYPGGYPDRLFVAQMPPPPQNRSELDTHLRSSKEVAGYGVEAKDARFGHVEDFIIDDESWAIRYLAIDTKNYWPSKSVIIAPDWVQSINWPAKTVSIDLNSLVVKNAPEYKADSPISRDYEKQLYDYYGRQTYWSSDVKPSSVEHNVAHTPDAELPDPSAPRVGKEVLTREDAKKAG